MKPTYKNAISKLKNGGHIVINIANTTTADFLEQSTIDIIQGLGCVLCRKMDMALSSIAGNGVKTEPIYVFKKALARRERRTSRQKLKGGEK